MGIGLIMTLCLETLIAMRLVREDTTEQQVIKIQERINDACRTHTQFLSQ